MSQSSQTPLLTRGRRRLRFVNLSRIGSKKIQALAGFLRPSHGPGAFFLNNLIFQSPDFVGLRVLNPQSARNFASSIAAGHSDLHCYALYIQKQQKRRESVSVTSHHSD
jgi:hypothetical protein